MVTLTGKYGHGKSKYYLKDNTVWTERRYWKAYIERNAFCFWSGEWKETQGSWKITGMRWERKEILETSLPGLKAQIGRSQEIKHCQPCYESSAFTLLITTPSFFLFVTTILILWKNSSCFSLVLVLRYGFNFTKFRLNLELTPTGVSS